MMCKCDDCSHVCEASELKDIRHLSMRLDHSEDDPRCIMPEGECPKCGALSYEISQAEVTAPAESTTPAKAALYKTARLTSEALKLQPQPVANDGFVRVEFERVQYNPKFKADENLFRAYSEGTFLGHFFERALCDFCL